MKITWVIEFRHALNGKWIPLYFIGDEQRAKAELEECRISRREFFRLIKRTEEVIKI